MTKDPLALAFVGCGFVAQQCHLPCFASNDLFEIKCLADPFIDLASSLASQYNVPRVVESHSDVCSMDDIDAVVVTLPRPLTAAVVQDLAAAGKHILTEKPISLNSSSKEPLLDICDKLNVSVMTGYMRQHDSGALKYRDLIRSLLVNTDITSIFAYSHMGDSYASPFGDKKGAQLADIHYEKQDFPFWLSVNQRYAFEQFINVFSHLTHTLGFVFDLDLSIIGLNLNHMGEGHILCRLGESVCTIELIRGSQRVWREGIVTTFRSDQVRLEFLPAFLRNQPARVIHMSDQQGKTELPCDWSWAFRNQSTAFYDYIHSDYEVRRRDLLNAYKQVEFAEEIFRRLEV